jgi:ppGpp synthetase/RelA/SpoT-type nucleotidyltranferase
VLAFAGQREYGYHALERAIVAAGDYLKEADSGVVGDDRGPESRPLQLADEASFLAHPWVEDLISRFVRDDTLSRHAMRRLTADLKKINELYVVREHRALFTSIDGRVKTQRSFFRKLYRICIERSSETGITPQILLQFYLDIKDLCGVRFACPYYDEVEPAIKLVRSFIHELGYATIIPNLPDRNYLNSGDAQGYRSCHFYVKVPTTISIYGDVELCLCEVQVRSELQHIWAVKSHDLLYKADAGWQLADRHVIEDMKQLSNSLRAADQALLSIRDRARGGSDGA